jgi:Protein of unknown function (DUF2490)
MPAGRLPDALPSPRLSPRTSMLAPMQTATDYGCTRRATCGRWLLVLQALLLAAPPALAAQQRQTSENTNFWLTLNGEHELRRRWFADYELNMRWSGPLREKMQFIPRLSVRFEPRPGLRFNWGYNYSQVWPYGSLPAPLAFPEHRMWEQVQFSHPYARLTVNHRYRLEQRWNGRTVLEDGETRVANWVRINRIRYRLQGRLPLQGSTVDDGEFYTNASAEVMLQWGANVEGNTFDQNRVIWSVGRRFSRGLRMEAGFMEQLTLRGNGRSLERNHTILFTIFPSSLLPVDAPG